MVRPLLVLLLSLTTDCADNPYVIGRLLDGGAADAGSSQCPSDALFCSGFEAADLREEWMATSIIEDAALERTLVRAHSGEAALRAESRGPDSAAVVVTTFPVQRAGSLFLRAYVYIASEWDTNTMNLFFIGNDPAEPFIGIDVNIEAGAVQVFSPQFNPVRTTGDGRIGRDRWVCLRAEVAIADDAGAVRVWLDDALALEVNDVDTSPEGGIHLFRAGVDWSSEQTTFFEVYLDDIALGNRLLDCS
jgi:hypothetical protein